MKHRIEEFPLCIEQGKYVAMLPVTVGTVRLMTHGEMHTDFECRVTARSVTAPLRLLFSIRGEEDTLYGWEIAHGGIRLFERIRSREYTVIERNFAVPSFPWNIRMVRTGAYTTLFINEQPVGWCPLFVSHFEYATAGYAGIEPGGNDIASAEIEPFCFGARYRDRILQPRGDLPWTGGQILPGALLRQGDAHYLYFIGVDKTAEGSESGGQARMGVAMSDDLIHWAMKEEPILETAQKTGEYSQFREIDSRDFRTIPKGTGAWDGLYLFVNGAVTAPDGRPAVMYSGFDGRWWRGIGLAQADAPAERFTPCPDNPIFGLGKPGSWDEGAMHEFDLMQQGEDYLLFYAGFDGTVDRGGIARSRDLVHWDRPDTPCFGPQFDDWWDTQYVRPRSLLRVGDTYYLFYEGCNFYHGAQYGRVDRVFDTVGLARSKDLRRWEYHPRNPILAESIRPGAPDADWTGWPKAVIKDDVCYVYYSMAGGGVCGTGLLLVPLRQLTDWN